MQQHAERHQSRSLLVLLCITVLEAEVAKLGQAVAAAKLEYDAAAARLEELRQRLKECDREISALAADKAALVQQVTDLAVDKKKLQHKYAVWPARMHMA
jgi:chromosome segregation ATPase